MKWFLVCLGILLIPITGSYAQDPASETSNLHSRTSTSDKSSASVSNLSPAKAQAGDTSSKDVDLTSPRAETHVRLGGVAVSAGYAHFSSSAFYPYFPYGPLYGPIGSPLWWDPFWGASSAFYPVGYFDPGNGKGELKLSGAPKDASVYVNQGYAGTVDHLKSIWLDPGAYDLVLSAADGRRYEQRIYVLTGKTLKIQAKMAKPGERGKM